MAPVQQGVPPFVFADLRESVAEGALAVLQTSSIRITI
jgi:hypothetical protein